MSVRDPQCLILKCPARLHLFLGLENRGEDGHRATAPPRHRPVDSSTLRDPLLVACEEAAPGDHLPIRTDRCEGAGGRFNLLNLLERVVHRSRVATQVCMTPGNHLSSVQNGCKGT